MSRSSAALLALSLVGCVGSRRIDLEWHTPAECPMTSACPLGQVRAINTRLERVDGTLAADECVAAPDGLCTLEDLADYLLLARASPSDGVEILVTGWTDPCPAEGEPPEGELALGCETFGVGVIDLERTDVVPMWCDCPYVVP